MIHIVLPVGLLRCNCSILGDEETRDAIVVDPGDNVDGIIQQLQKHRLTVKAIVITHAHIDHVAGANKLRMETHAPVYMSEHDLNLLKNLDIQAGWLGIPTPETSEIDILAKNGTVLQLNRSALHVLETPGHTEGSLCLWIPSENKLIAGDTLFRESIGRTDLPGGDSKKILASIQNVLFPLPDNATVTPGHGLPTTIGHERIHNPFLQKHWMKLVALFFAASLVGFPATIRVFGHNWAVPDQTDWQVETVGTTEILHLVHARGPLPGPKRPIQFALLDMPPASETTIEADVQPLQRSLIIVYAYQDEAHFNYAHLSTDTGTAQPVHNGIFHVFGGERVRISSQAGPPAFPTRNRWCHVKLVFNGSAGLVDVLVDNQPVAALHAIDLSLTHGRVGFGSFDETGDFKNVRLTGIFSDSPLSLQFLQHIAH